MAKTPSKVDPAKENTPAQEMEAYLAALPHEARAILEDLRRTIKAAAPEATEVISYRMPTFKYRGRPLVGFAAFKEHCSLFPMSLAVMEACKDDLQGYDTANAKGTIRFSVDKPLPAALVQKIVTARMKEIEARTAVRKPKTARTP